MSLSEMSELIAVDADVQSGPVQDVIGSQGDVGDGNDESASLLNELRSADIIILEKVDTIVFRDLEDVFWTRIACTVSAEDYAEADMLKMVLKQKLADLEDSRVKIARNVTVRRDGQGAQRRTDGNDGADGSGSGHDHAGPDGPVASGVDFAPAELGISARSQVCKGPVPRVEQMSFGEIRRRLFPPGDGNGSSSDDDDDEGEDDGSAEPEEEEESDDGQWWITIRVEDPLGRTWNNAVNAHPREGVLVRQVPEVAGWAAAIERLGGRVWVRGRPVERPLNAGIAGLGVRDWEYWRIELPGDRADHAALPQALNITVVTPDGTYHNRVQRADRQRMRVGDIPAIRRWEEQYGNEYMVTRRREGQWQEHRLDEVVETHHRLTSIEIRDRDTFTIVNLHSSDDEREEFSDDSSGAEGGEAERREGRSRSPRRSESPSERGRDMPMPHGGHPG